MRATTMVSTMLLGAISVGCSGGGSPGPAVNLQGYWQAYMQVTGAPEAGPFPTYFEQVNGQLNGLGGTGSVSGNNIVFNGADPIVPIQFTGTSNGTTFSGGFVVAGGLATGTFRMDPFQPAGSLVASGMVNANAVDFTSTTAIGERLYDDVGLTNLVGVVVMHMGADMELDLSFDPATLAVGTSSVPSQVSVDVSFMDDALSHELFGTGGSVTVTKYDDTGFAASYTISMGTGESVTGTFDVAWDLDAFIP